MIDEENGMWATRNEGQGAWISIKFKQLIQLSRLEYINRRNPAERNSIIELTYDNGDIQTINLKNTSEIREINLKPIKTTSVKILIKSVYGTINNGGGFNFYGVACINTDNINKQEQDLLTGMEKVSGVGKKPIKPLFNVDKPKAIKLHCKDSVSNSRKFDTVKKGYNDKVLIYCNENCSPADVPVYGNTNYSKDSAVCKSAFHSQKLPSEGGNVWLIFQNGKNSYPSMFRNGVKSSPKGKSDVSFSFEIYKEEDDIILQPGSKIDIANTIKIGWLPGIITNIIDKDEFMKIIMVTIEGGTKCIYFRQRFSSGNILS